MNLEKKTILITGGTSGIGLELAKQLLLKSNTVIVTGRDPVKLDEVKRSLPAIHVFKSDVSDPQAIDALFEAVTSRFPELDVLINNAGIMRNLDLSQDRDPMDLTREIETNLSGPVRMVQKFLPHLKARKDALIVNVSSGLAFVPSPASPVYCATKAALHSYTQSLRVQLGGSGVTVVELAPPAVDTPLLRDVAGKNMKSMNAMDVAALARKTIRSIESGCLEITPGLSGILKTMSRIAPGFMLKQLTKIGMPKSER